MKSVLADKRDRQAAAGLRGQRDPLGGLLGQRPTSRRPRHIRRWREENRFAGHRKGRSRVLCRWTAEDHGSDSRAVHTARIVFILFREYFFSDWNPLAFKHRSRPLISEKLAIKTLNKKTSVHPFGGLK